MGSQQERPNKFRWTKFFWEDWVNDPALKLCEPAAQAFANAIHPEDRERVLQAYAAASFAESGGELAVEFRTAGADTHKERWVSVRARMLFDEAGLATRLIGTTRDVTRRKNLEEQLRRRVEELQKIMDVVPVALFTAKDPECRVITGNPAASVPAGFTPEGLPVGIQIVGRNKGDFSVLQMAHAFEQATGFGKKRPGIV